jgi:bzd-type benzoyl-CoA reductase Q subunit
MITAGVDIGSLSADVVILKDNEILGYSVIRTGPDSAKTAQAAMNAALEDVKSKGTDLKLEDIDYIVSTGYGRVIVPFAQKNITEISCHAKGANWFFPGVRTILDMGGQDCKAIKCDQTGKVKKFHMNDKCAAGTGRSMEVMADLLDIKLEDIGPLSLQIKDEFDIPVISTICVIFAKSEVLSLVRKGIPVENVLAGLCEATAKRVKTQINVVGSEEEFVITGGIAKNEGVVKRVEELVGMKANICFEPQIVGALGAAIFARDRYEKQLKKEGRKAAAEA